MDRRSRSHSQQILHKALEGQQSKTNFQIMNSYNVTPVKKGGGILNKESIYDEKFQPLMTQIIDICKEHDMRLHATYELDGTLRCTTQLTGTLPSSMWLYLMLYAAKASNIDNFLFAVMQHAKLYGHSSIMLIQLGVLPNTCLANTRNNIPQE